MTNPANTLDCAASAAIPDPDCGAGFLLADRALAMALDNTPPVVTAVVSPAAPDGSNGWYREPVTVTWSVSDRRVARHRPGGLRTREPRRRLRVGDLQRDERGGDDVGAA